MSTYLRIRDTLVPMDCESVSTRSPDRMVSEFTGITGSVVRFRAPRPRAHITLGFGLSRPNELRSLSALAAGEFGNESVRVVDAWAQRTNLLDRATSILERWADNATYSTVLRPTDDGMVLGRALVNVPATTGVGMMGGTGFYAPAPPAGQWVTVSAYATGGQARIRPAWSTASGASVAGSWSAAATTPSGGVMGRIHTAALTPETVTVGGVQERVVGVGLIVSGVSGPVVAAAPCVTWSPDLLPYMDGQCPLRMVMNQPTYTPIMAHGDPRGQAASAQVTFEEVG